MDLLAFSKKRQIPNLANLPNCGSCTEELLAAASSLFDAAITRKTITSAEHDQIAYKFQSMLEEFNLNENPPAIGTFLHPFDFLNLLSFVYVFDADGY